MESDFDLENYSFLPFLEEIQLVLLFLELTSLKL